MSAPLLRMSSAPRWFWHLVAGIATLIVGRAVLALGFLSLGSLHGDPLGLLGYLGAAVLLAPGSVLLFFAPEGWSDLAHIALIALGNATFDAIWLSMYLQRRRAGRVESGVSARAG